MVDPAIPPHSLEAERAVLGAMLLDGDAIDVALEVLVAEDFYREAHRLIFAAISGLYAKPGSKVDELLLCDHLAAQGKLDDIGGPETLRELSYDVTSSALIESHARIVREKGALRGLIRVAREALREAMHPAADSETVIETLERKLVEIRRPGMNRTVSIGEASDLLLEDLRNGEDRRAVASTGFEDIDRTLWGFGPGQFVILAGRPSMGKSTLAVNFALNIAAAGTPVLFYSLEMEILELAANAVRKQAQMAFRDGMDINGDAAWDSVESAVEWLRDLPIYIEAPPSLTPSTLRSHARRMARQGKAGFIIVDYAQLVESPVEKGKRGGGRVEELERVSRELKRLAKELQVPVLAVAQLNREAVKDDNTEPMLYHLKGSGAFEQDSDKVIFIYRPKGQTYNLGFGEQGYQEIAIKIAKHRNGPVADRIPLKWFKSQFRFSDM
ncbi:hypothetical protein LCGC14_0817120 [marine sediment metagenome]|uniref:DNA 5'-3' helicase n=1 Tax=marine sediment metagenome TaxID=412755 RepID=A0A0F9S4U2_9ZZZZ